MKYFLPSNHETLNLCCFNVGPTSKTMGHNKKNIGLMYRVLWIISSLFCRYTLHTSPTLVQFYPEVCAIIGPAVSLLRLGRWDHITIWALWAEIRTFLVFHLLSETTGGRRLYRPVQTTHSRNVIHIYISTFQVCSRVLRCDVDEKYILKKSKCGRIATNLKL